MTQTTINRRRALAVVAAVPAAAALGAPAFALGEPDPRASELPGLIKAHRAAYRAFCRAIKHQERMNDAYEKTDVIVPCLLGGGYSLSQGYEFCQQQIASAYRNQRDRLPQLSRVAPNLAQQFRAIMDAKEAENMALLDRLMAEEEARKEAFGLAAAERDWESTEEAEHKAAIAVSAYRCRTLKEARMKAQYLATSPNLGCDAMQPEHVEALLQSFIGEEQA